MIAALLMLAQIAPVEAEPKPVPATIAAIRANPKKFNGQVVRVHGYLDSCEPLSCVIHERPANAREGAGAGLSIGEDKKFDETVKRLLPTYVEMDARFDSSCETGAVCTGRSPELTIVQLRAVVSPEPPPFENP